MLSVFSGIQVLCVDQGYQKLHLDYLYFIALTQNWSHELGSR